MSSNCECRVTVGVAGWCPWCVFLVSVRVFILEINHGIQLKRRIYENSNQLIGVIYVDNLINIIKISVHYKVLAVIYIFLVCYFVYSTS